MRIAGYIRVSTADQALHGYSLDAQTDLIERYCASHNYTLIRIYADEGKSASKALHKRKGIISLLEDAESGEYDCIVFKDLTRWSRSPSQFYAVQERLDKCKVSWISIEQPNLETVTAQGRLMVGITISVAAHESAQTSDRIKFVNQSRVKTGGVLSGHCPIGYKIAEVDGMKRIVIDEETKEFTKALFEHFEAHPTILGTCRWMRENGYPRSDVSVRSLLMNPLYKGCYRDNENYCEPYLTPERWDNIQKILSRNNYNAPKHTYIFSSLVRCKECGRVMTGRTQPWNGKEYAYYSCSNNHKFKRCPHNLTIREDAIEKFLIENVETELKKLAVKPDKQTKKNAARAKAKLSRLNDLYIDGRISREEYDKRREELEKELAQITPQRAVNPMPDGWMEYYKGASKEAKHASWSAILDHIEVDNENHIRIFF